MLMSVLEGAHFAQRLNLENSKWSRLVPNATGALCLGYLILDVRGGVVINSTPSSVQTIGFYRD